MLAGSERQIVALTGGSGFIGSACLNLLSRRAMRLRALVLPGESLGPFANIDIVEGDVRDPQAVSRFVGDATTVIHLAGPPSVARSFQYPTETRAVHTLGTARLLEACVRGRVERFVYVSSAEVYGAGYSAPIAESKPRSPRSPYGEAKSEAEDLVGTWAQEGRSAAVLRPFSVYGPRAPAVSVTMEILRQVNAGGTVALRDGSVVRDFCYVSDVAEAIHRSALVDISGYQVLNVGSGEGTSIRALAEKALLVANRPKTWIKDLGRPRAQGTEVPHLVADTSLAKGILGWSPTTDLATGLGRTLLWMRTRGSGS